ncbi:MAG: 2-amino-4-hydroxy-6-hydroxymethyldihydropteridine diphosphokinase [Proteobacteria bacterium]|nr:2-amino-4-hydroxy-6-hydroxymethyldihydropteridine diphosphokinase [Pseudomonadota bacterium]MBS0464916.1 2-amino-4-hydroxy-6-hydroxymethyldihydropteridine diphosphokinase [Pseudomonadota bacterium]
MNQTLPVVACIGLGGNLGDVPAAIARAIDALDRLPQTQVRCRSRLYRTPAWGLTAQPDFINAAAVLETTLAAPVLLEHLLDIERHAGRVRDAALRWGPRTLDLDLLLYGEAVIAQDGLHVPHPHLHERAFVLVPLAQIAPDVMVPGRGVVRDLLAGVDAREIVAIDPA